MKVQLEDLKEIQLFNNKERKQGFRNVQKRPKF